MKRNRDYTFYTLCYDHEEIDGKRFIDLSQRREIEQIADRFEGDFIGSHAYQKWDIEYYFSLNNEAFLDHIAEFDTPAQVHDILYEQLYNYIERTPVVPSVSMLEDPVILTNQWLENTRFICKQAYKKTGNEVYKLAVKWCKWKKEQIDTRHGLDRVRNDEFPLTHNHAAIDFSDNKTFVPSPATFEDLFYRAVDVDKCVDALREFDIPLLSDTGTWIGPKRGKNSSVSIVVAWVRTMEERGIIKQYKDRPRLAVLLNDFFPGLDMGTRTDGMFTKESETQHLYTSRFLSIFKKQFG